MHKYINKNNLNSFVLVSQNLICLNVGDKPPTFYSFYLNSRHKSDSILLQQDTQFLNKESQDV